MTATARDVAAAQAEATAAKTRLSATIGELQGRLQPRVLAHDAAARLKVRGSEMADDALDAARARPGVVGAAGGAIVLFLLRRPLGRLVGRMFSRRDETAGTSAS